MSAFALGVSGRRAEEYPDLAIGQFTERAKLQFFPQLGKIGFELGYIFVIVFFDCLGIGLGKL